MARTAQGTYAVVASVKSRLGWIAGSYGTADVTMLTSICDQVDAYIEAYTGRVLAPIGSATYSFDGYDRITPRLFQVPRGVRNVTLLEISTYTGGPYNTVPSTDFFLRPTDQEKDPEFPHTEILMTNIPSAGNYAPIFYEGFNTVRITATWGFPAVPDDIHEVAEVMAVRSWYARQAGQTDQVGGMEYGGPTISRSVSARDRETLARYRLKRPTAI